jgi:hypothetical protein
MLDVLKLVLFAIAAAIIMRFAARQIAYKLGYNRSDGELVLSTGGMALVTRKFVKRPDKTDQL